MVKLPDKKSLEGISKKITEAVKLPDDSEKPTASKPETGLSEKELEKIREEERKRIEKEQKDKEAAEKAKKYEEIEAQKRAEEQRLLEEKKKQVEMERLEKERLAEEAIKQKEREAWSKEEEKKRLEIEKELLRKQKEEQKAAGKQNHTLRNIGIVVVIILAVIAAGYISLITGNDNINAYGYPLSYSATYDILIPDNSDISFSGIPVKALSSGDSVTIMINNDRKTISKGQTAVFPAKHLTIKTLGITVFDSDYEITATYRGVVTNRDDFLTVIKTSQPIPSWLVSLMTPSGVGITPV